MNTPLDRPPNILFLMSDQHRYDVAGFMGNDIVRTPHLDRLAADAHVFENAYTPSPICVPGRQCLMSGQHLRTNQCRKYGDDLEPFSLTFAEQLSRVGYHTVCAGKLHHQGRDQMQGWQRRIGMDQHVETEHYGAEAVAASDAYAKGKAATWDLTKELRMAGPGVNYYGVNDDYTVRGCLNYIRESFAGRLYDRTEHRPMMLKVSLQQPHYPFICGEERFNYYINRVQPYAARSGIIEHGFARDWTHNPPVTEREKMRAIAAYYGMVEEVDSAFGVVLNELQALGQNLDEWVIVYTSDHGDMLGEFNTWWKLKFYEGSVRVPLFIRAPRLGYTSRRMQENISLCDLYATLCEVAGVNVPEDRDSRSLLPIMAGDSSTEWPDTAESAYMDHWMIKVGTWKYWKLAPDTEVLFDLETDPHEQSNRVDDPSCSDILSRCRDLAPKA